MRLLPYTDPLLAPSDAPFAFLGCAILLDGQKNWLNRQIHCALLPDSFHDARGPKMASEGVKSASEYGTLLVFRQFVNYLASLLSLAVRIKGEGRSISCPKSCPTSCPASCPIWWSSVQPRFFGTQTGTTCTKTKTQATQAEAEGKWKLPGGYRYDGR